MATTKKLDATGLSQVWNKITTNFDTKDSVDSKVGVKADKATSLNGYGISDAYTKTETDNKITSAVNTAVAGIYKVKGSTTFAKLPTSASVGDVYNVTDAFTTTSSFVEGAGKSYPAGTNVAYTDNGWDCLAGVYDFSEYLKASDLENITESEIDAICVIS
jgi:glutamate mutase epsilon subunit